MKRRSITIYSVLISAVLTFSVAFLIINLALEYSHGEEKAEQAISRIQQTLKKSGNSEMLAKAAGGFLNYQAIYIYKNSNLIYAYPCVPEMRLKDTKLIKIYETDIANDRASYRLKAAFYLLSPSAIFNYVRFSFLITMAATLSTAALLIYLSCMDKNSEQMQLSAETDESIAEPEEDEALSNLQDAKNETETPPEPETAAPDEPETPATEDSALESGDETPTDTPNTAPVQNKEESPRPPSDSGEPAALEHTDTQENAVQGEDTLDVSSYEQNSDATLSDAHYDTEQSEETKDLFSPVTGFGWEPNFKLRLDSELIRAASSEQDLSLFIIKIKNLAYTDDITAKISAYLLDIFQFRDMIFEYGTDSFAVIKPDLTIEQAESLAGAIHTELTKIFADKPELACFIGISSRSIRMLSAERLVMEAAQALNHSMEDEESPITGFHVDIDKYRDFLNNN